MGYLVGYTYRTFNGFCECKWGGTPLEFVREKRGGQIPRTFPFGIMGFVKPVHAQKWQGQRMVLGAYLGARYSTGGGCFVYPVSVDSTGVREVIKGHNFRVRDQSPWYDVNVLFPLLAGAYVDPRSGEQALPPPPVHDPERSVKRPLEDSGGAGVGGEVAGEEGDGDMEVEIPLPEGSLAPEGAGEPMDLDVVLDRVIQHAQNEAMNEFLAGASRCDEVGGDVEAEGQGSSISVQFGGNQIDVQIAEGVCDELTGHPIAHDQVVEGIRRHWKLVTPILRRSVAPSQLNMKFKSSQRGGYLPKRLLSFFVPGWSSAITPLVLKAPFGLASMPLQVV